MEMMTNHLFFYSCTSLVSTIIEAVSQNEMGSFIVEILENINIILR